MVVMRRDKFQKEEIKNGKFKCAEVPNCNIKFTAKKHACLVMRMI